MDNKNIINPEYKIVGDNNYLPFSENKKKIGQISSESSLVVIPNVDGSNGVTLYDNDNIVIKTVATPIIKHTFNKDSKLLHIDIAADDLVQKFRGDNGVLVEDDQDVFNGKVIKLDDDYVIRQGEF